MKRLTDLGAGLDRFYERLEPLSEAGKLGPVLWQLPATFHRDDDRLGAALEALPDGRHCFEFRHPSWFCEPVYELLGARDVALVVGDHPKWPFQERRVTSDWTLLRLHHGRRGRRGNYAPTELASWRRRIAQWRRRATIFAYLNNDWNGFAVRNALVLRDGPRARLPG